VEKARRDHRCIGQSRREPVIGPEAVTESGRAKCPRSGLARPRG
jgi:hypothetical protein